MTPVTLHTRRLELSMPTTSDVDAITSACQDPEIPRWTVVPSPYTDEHAADFVGMVAKWWADDEATTWGIRHDNALVGMIGLHDVASNPSGGDAEIGFWMAPQYRGKGYVTEACEAVIAWGFSELRLARIEWRAVAGNLASARAAQSLGFQYEGLLRQGHSSPRGRADAWVAGLLATDDRIPIAWDILSVDA